MPQGLNSRDGKLFVLGGLILLSGLAILIAWQTWKNRAQS
jgi:hypothetical protein